MNLDALAQKQEPVLKDLTESGGFNNFSSFIPHGNLKVGKHFVAMVADIHKKQEFTAPSRRNRAKQRKKTEEEIKAICNQIHEEKKAKRQDLEKWVQLCNGKYKKLKEAKELENIWVEGVVKFGRNQVPMLLRVHNQRQPA
jgi:uncharacterized protein YydD (DUF2326 family)